MTCIQKPYRLQLGKYLYLCPEPWIKFVQTVNPTGHMENQVDLALRDVYHARLVNHVVKFDSREDYMMFLMNWS